jgi:hypothetical protein
MKGQLSFPESDFPVPAEFQAEYQVLVRRGLQRMSGTKVAICGLARNVASVLPYTLSRIEQLGSMFTDYRAIIYENDSSDGTKSLLLNWAQHNPKATVVLEQLGDPVNPIARCLKRAERMARYRNACLEIVRERFADFSHVIIVDTDLHHGWSVEGIANTFGQENWDFVGANGLILRRRGISLNEYLQYDAWAFRCDEEFSPLSTAEVNKMRWSRGQSLVPVTSCLGGLGIYRMPAFLAGTYTGDDTEHVTHLRAARQRGFDRVFLNPSQITLYGRHHRRSDWWMIPLIQAGTRVFGTNAQTATVFP